jgi:multimeric flavodoxin WrbA
MNVGIIVYSQTGHTLAVSERLQKAMSAAGHSVGLERLEIVGPAGLHPVGVPLKTKPEIAPYEALVFCTPVQGGEPAPPMAAYLEQLSSLQGKQVACLVTGFFPAGWGRNQTIAQMRATCESKGATVLGSGSVGWLSFSRGRQIAKLVAELGGLF